MEKKKVDVHILIFGSLPIWPDAKQILTNGGLSSN